MTCYVNNCKNTRYKEKFEKKGITFHCLPKSEELRSQWLTALNLKDWNSENPLTICSEHFDESSFNRSSLCYVRLRENAVPTIIDSSSSYFVLKKTKQNTTSGVSCAVPGCNATRRNEPKRRFFRFPNKNKKAFNKWIEICAIPSSKINKYLIICGIHFYKKDFGKRKLRRGAIPNLFLPNSSMEIDLNGKHVEFQNDGDHNNMDCKFNKAELDVASGVVTSNGQIKRETTNYNDTYVMQFKRRAEESQCNRVSQISKKIRKNSIHEENLSSDCEITQSEDPLSNWSSPTFFAPTYEELLEEPPFTVPTDKELVEEGQSPSSPSEINGRNSIKYYFRESVTGLAETPSYNKLEVRKRAALKMKDAYKVKCTKFKFTSQQNRRGKQKKLKLKNKLKEIKNVGARDKRPLKKLKSLSSQLDIEGILNELKLKNLLTDDHFDDLMNIVGDQKILISQQMIQHKYEELKEFVMNLNFYSPKAYDYVQTEYTKCLPSDTCLSSLYKGVDGQPGFSNEAFLILNEMAKSATRKIVVNLVLDEMAIQAQREWDGKQCFGNVDIGNGIQSDILATHVFVLMVVGVNSTWKLPVAWFPIVTLSGIQKKNLISMCMQLLLSINIEIVGISSDGISTNCTLATLLGCNLEYPFLNPIFHLENNPTDFCFSWDPSHMIKLVRNSLEENGPLVDQTGNLINWKYLDQLQKLQNDEDRIRIKAPTFFERKKIKLKLATEYFSEYITDALEFCKTDLNLSNFQNCDGTITFLRHLKRIFDILNSRCFRKSCFQKCLCESNFVEIQEYVQEAVQYLSTLKFENDELIVNSRRKTGFIGLIMGLKALEILYERFFQYGLLKCFPNYKLSQDHTQIFFELIRSRLGHNPTVRQFSAAYKKLLVHCQLKESGISSLPIEETNITDDHNVDAGEIINSTIAGRKMFDGCNNSTEITVTELEENQFILDSNSSEYACYVVENIADFIVKHLNKKLHCETCIKALGPDSATDLNSLVKLHSDVITICRVTESEIRMARVTSAKPYPSSIPNKRNIRIVAIEVQNRLLEKKIFSSLEDHIEHRCFLVKCIIEKYIQIKLYYMGKMDKQLSSIRHFLHKLKQGI